MIENLYKLALQSLTLMNDSLIKVVIVVSRRMMLFLAIIASFASIFGFIYALGMRDLMPLTLGILASLLGGIMVFGYATTVRLIRNRPTIFFSYTHHDTAFVMKLVDDLRKMNVEPIVDRLELKVGEDIRRAVSNMIDKSDYFLFVVSENSMKSDWAKKELEQALTRKKRVLPVVLDDKTLPEQLSVLFYADFSSEYQKGLAQLKRTLCK